MADQAAAAAAVAAQDQELQTLKGSQKAIRSSVTKLCNNVDGLLKSANLTSDDLEDALAILQPKEVEMNELDQRVENLTTGAAEREKETSRAIEFRDRIIVTKARINRKLNQLVPNYSATTSIAGSVSGSSVTTSKPATKLPTLTMTKFNGDVTKWTSFWSHFQAAVENRQGMAKVDKFSYLVSFLEGEAASVLNNMIASEEAYDDAVKMLNDRYGRKDIIIHSLMNKLIDTQAVRKSSDTKALRKLVDSCDGNIRSLKNQGVNMKENGTFLCPALLRCIPNDIRLDYSRSKGANDDWDVEGLLDFLRKDIQNREVAEMLGKLQNSEVEKSSQGQNYNNREKYPKQEKFKGQGSASALTVYRNFPGKNIYCIFCKSTNHSSINCSYHAVEDKRNMIRAENRCFNCIRMGHDQNSCRSQFKTCRKCNQKHNIVVCDQLEVNKRKNTQVKTLDNEREQGQSESTNMQVAINTHVACKKTILLQTAQALALNPKNQNKIEPLRCLLDGGSQMSFITEDISQKLKLPVIGKTLLTIFNFGNKDAPEVSRKIVRVTLQNIKNPNESVEIEAIEVPYICRALVKPRCEEIENHLIQKGLQLADDSNYGNNNIGVLIGGDTYWEFASGKSERLGKATVALETKLGWAISGPVEIESAVIEAYSTFHISVEERADEMMKNLWELESIGIKGESENIETKEDIIKGYSKNLSFEKGRYVVKFPWKTDRENLPNNFSVAKMRMKPLIRKFDKDPKYFQDYRKVLQEQLDLGIIEQVPDSEINSKQCYYLPHQGVKREVSSTTKLRVVLDGSSHEKGAPSLNDVLLAGPNLNPDLLMLLLRFRTHKVAITADIEKAFLQVGLAREDKDMTRFLWVQEINGEIDQNNFRVFRMTRVPFGISSSPFLLAITIKLHAQKFEKLEPRAAKLIDEDIYVDDVVSGAKSVKEAFEISNKVNNIVSEAGMRLRKWNTNDKELRKLWGEEGKNYSPKTIYCKNENIEKQKVLGLSWDPETDKFSFNLEKLVEYLLSVKNTKRAVLSSVSQIFDPMGILGPFTIRAKLMFQKLWEEKVAWDEELEERLAIPFQEWCRELPSLRKIKFDRYYLDKLEQNDIANIEIHAFCDASKVAYAAVIYLKVTTNSGETKIVLVMAKSRVAPLKDHSVPKLELMGCLLGARLIDYTKDIYKDQISKTYLWSDSTVALYWIKGAHKTWKPFVSNRVQEIQKLTKVENWGHCPGENNPADLATRGIKAKDLENCKIWFEGPPWLKFDSQQWPKTPLEIPEKLVDSERRKVALHVQCQEPKFIQNIISLNRFSKISKPIRITAWILRFLRHIKKGTKTIGELTTEELSSAENLWVKHCQREIYPDEIKNLENNKPIETKSKIATLKPFINEDGLLCVGGRLGESELSYREKHPAILNQNVRLAALLMERSHKEIMHAGVQSTITNIREKYWIISGRQLAKQVVKRCYECKRLNSKPGQMPEAPLPGARIIESQPFETIGIDFAGPIFVKEKSGKQTTVKSYICLFVCSVTRALHLELVQSLSTEDFLLAIRRMIARRGIPKIIYSDNAKTFIRANEDFKELWQNLKTNDILNFFGKKGISWRFIAPKAPWWGGQYERMVRSIKSTLKKVLGKAVLSHIEMETILTETEAMLNSRPLTFVYNDVNEPSPLTPGHFLIGKRLNSLPSQKLNNIEVNASRLSLTKRLKYRQTLLERVWKRWRSEYLMDLRSAHHTKLTNQETQFKDNEVVLVHEDKIPRQNWKIGVVTENQKGRDGKVRSCLVRMANGNVIRRPIQLLYPLEIVD